MYARLCLLLLSLSPLAQAGVVKTAPLETLLQTPLYSAPAEVIQTDQVTLSSQLTALVETVQVDVGHQVKAGQPLLTLACQDFQLQRQQADATLQSLQAQHRLAQQQLKRAQRLLKQRNASRELFDQRQADVRRLDAELNGAEVSRQQALLSIERCSLKAPFDAVVLERQAVVGSLAQPGSSQFRLQALSGAELQAYLPAEDVASLRASQQLWYKYNGTEYPVLLRVLMPRLEQQSRNRQARLMFSEQEALPGSSGRLYWQGVEPRLPVRYLVERGGVAGVMLAEAGQARFVPLPDAVPGRPVLVDLPVSSEVIIEGQFALQQGDSVEVVLEAASDAQADQ